MRRLVRCGACRRQYDATARPVGAVFRCRCGAPVKVADVEAHEAAVVSCRSCGGTRQAGAAACSYCGSDFTIHEQDLDTICPACFARISGRARYCHHCATAIAPEEAAGDISERTCPACGDGRTLRSRAIGAVAALECERCAGLWLGEQAFQIAGEKARKESTPFPSPKAVADAMKGARKAIVPQKGVLYRPCPICSERMHRHNFGKVSGVVLDRCPGHGFWFDASELEAALTWIRIGGEKQTAERTAQADRERASLDKLRVQPKSPDDPEPAFRGGYQQEYSWLWELVSLLGTKMRS